MRTKALNRNEMLRTIYNNIESHISWSCLNLISTLTYFYLLENPWMSTICLKYIFKLRSTVFLLFRKPTDQKTVEYHRPNPLPFCQTICVIFYMHWNPFDLQFNLQFCEYRKYANLLFQLVLYTFKFPPKAAYWDISVLQLAALSDDKNLCVNRRTFRKGQFEVELCKCEWLINANRWRQINKQQ